MLTAVIGVVVLLGGLIFFHELGHFLVAKSFGVRVEVFSLGFGKKIFSKQWGETEYALSLFPLGGYVKLMGDDPYKEIPAADVHRAFSTQQLYKRFLIVAAGPMANLLLAYVLFAIVFWVGKPMAASHIGTVEVNSPAYVAGLRSGDRIEQIDGTAVSSWEDLENYLEKRTEQKVELHVKRGTTELVVPVTVTPVKSRNAFGEMVLVGGIDGISELPLASRVGISDPKSPAYAAGLRTGDLITKIGSLPIATYEELQHAIDSQWKAGAPLTFTFKRPSLENAGSQDIASLPEQSFSVALPSSKPNVDATAPFNPASALGIYPSEIFVSGVNAGSPAAAGGLQVGDHILALDDKPIHSFNAILSHVQEQGAASKTIVFHLLRDGQKMQLNLVPEEVEQEDPLTRQMVKKYMVGFAPMAAYQRAEITKVQIRNPLELVGAAVNEANTLAKQMVVSIGKLVMGQISVKNLGGPVLIASVAGKSLDAGIIPFLQMMALISINLFLLNLFPIPVLDGGHLLFFTIEAIQRKPVSIRTMEIANQMGMVFILMLVGITLFNDISRIILH